MHEKIKQYWSTSQANNKLYEQILRFFGTKYPTLFQQNLRVIDDQINNELNEMLSNCLLSKSKRINVPYNADRSYHVALSRNGLRFAYSRGYDFKWTNLEKQGYDFMVSYQWRTNNSLLKLSTLRTRKDINQDKLEKFYILVDKIQEVYKPIKDKNNIVQRQVEIPKVCELTAEDIGVHISLLSSDNISCRSASLLSICNVSRHYYNDNWIETKNEGADQEPHLEIFLTHYDDIIEQLDILEQWKKEILQQINKVFNEIESENQPFKLIQKLKSKRHE